MPATPPEAKRLFLSPPHLDGQEAELLRLALESNYVAPLGPMVDAFERDCETLLPGRRCLALSSGTAALHLALRLLGVGPGDEVLVSTLTFIGSVTPVIFQGARPVFIDADPATWNMDPALLEGELTRLAAQGRRPKAVIPTDLYGQCADYERIEAVCRRFGVPLVVDAAESLGAERGGRPAGAVGEASIFSFNGNKIVTTSGGGMLTSPDEDFIAAARGLSQQARDDAPHYEHSTWGYNYRLSNLLAAVGRGQLARLPARVARKRELCERYQDALGHLPGLSFMPEDPGGRASRWLTVILLDQGRFGADAETVRLALADRNIEARPVWKPMHLQPVFRLVADPDGADLTNPAALLADLNQRLRSGPTPARTVGGGVAEGLFRRGLCLPSGTAMTAGDLDRVCAVVAACQDAGPAAERSPDRPTPEAARP